MTNLEFDSVVKTFGFNPVINDRESECIIGEVKFIYSSRNVRIKDLPYDVQLSLFDNYHDLIKEFSYSYSKNLNDFAVSTKEDLIAVIYELKRYYDDEISRLISDENELSDYVSSVNKRIINRVIPSIGTYKWMENDEINDLSFKRAMSKSNKSFYQRELRVVIDLFDGAVNPYMDDDIKMCKIKKYMKNVNISGDVWTEEDELGYERSNCCMLTITDKKTNNSVRYERNIDGFSCSLDYFLDDGRMMMVKHSYHGNSKNNYDRGEVITIRYFKDGKMNELNYNVTRDKAFYYTGDGVIVGKLSMKQKNNLYWELLGAAEKAEEVAIVNMVVNEPKKILGMR